MFNRKDVQMLKKTGLAVLTSCLLTSTIAFASATKENNKTAVFSEKELQTAAWIRDAARTDNLSYKILESLTTEVGPRMAGSPGDALAVAWAEAKFKELGFDKVWKEPVTFPSWKRGIEKAEITAPFPQALVITALGNTVATPQNGLTAELVEFATLKEMQAAPNDKVRGKIVFIKTSMVS